MNRPFLENLLGPPSAFIITPENADVVKQWALAAGFPDVQVHSMNNVALANLYCAHAGQAAGTPQQRQAAAMFLTMLDKMQSVAPVDMSPIEGISHYQTPLVIRIVKLAHAVMMVGPAGCGKTTIGQHVAIALDLPFYITSTINDTHELIGFVDGYGKYHDTPFRRAYENGGVWIADEIDAWDANALLAANSALANGFCAFPDLPEPLARHTDFRMVATANTFGNGADRIYVGRNELDAASLDRFASVNVDYDLDLERHFAKGRLEWLNHVWKIRKRVQDKKIRHVVSSRCISMGADALIAGIDWHDVEEIYLYKGMSDKDRSKIDGS